VTYRDSWQHSAVQLTVISHVTRTVRPTIWQPARLGGLLWCLQRINADELSSTALLTRQQTSYAPSCVHIQNKLSVKSWRNASRPAVDRRLEEGRGGATDDTGIVHRSASKYDLVWQLGGSLSYGSFNVSGDDVAYKLHGRNVLMTDRSRAANIEDAVDVPM